MKTFILLLVSLLISAAIQYCTPANYADQANENIFAGKAGKAIKYYSYQSY